jgi:multidrug efflux pump subunit AcrB
MVRSAKWRKLRDLALAPLLFRPYRCRACRKRFHYSRHFGTWPRRAKEKPARHHSRLVRRILRWRQHHGANFVKFLILALLVAMAMYAFFHFIAQEPGGEG